MCLPYDAIPRHSDNLSVSFAHRRLCSTDPEDEMMKGADENGRK